MTTPDAVNRTDKDVLDRSALSGVAWSSVAKWTTQIFSWATTILVARILTPSDYGLLSMAAAFTGVLLMLSEFGIGTTVLTMREIGADQLSELNGFSWLLGFTGTAVTVVAAYPLGIFFRAPALPPVLALVGCSFVIISVQTVPAALMRREMRFRSLAMIDLARGFAMPLVTLAGAMLGLRYWALALGSLAGAAVGSGLTLAYRRVPFAKPKLARLKPILQFSRDLLISRIAWAIHQNADFGVAGRRLGQAGAGVYTLAWTLATNPIDKLTQILSDVAPSLFSAVQDDRAALRRYFLNLSELVCLATFPASVGLALVSKDLVDVVLGAKWEGAAAPLSILACYAGFRSVTLLYSILFAAVRETRFGMWISIVGSGLMLIAFIVGSYWGGAGIAAAWLVMHPAISAYSFRKVRQVLDVTPGEYFRALRLGLDGTVLMAAGVELFRLWVAASWHPAARLIGGISCGAVVFGVSTWVLHGERLKQIVAWLRLARGGGAAGASPAA